MKLTKTVLAVAIAGIAATPMMASATTTLSGIVEINFNGSDDETDATNVNGEDGFEAGEAKMGVGDVLFGISSSQALNSGLTGYGSVRADFNSFSGGGLSDVDSVYVGVKGGFGDFRFGEVGNPGEYGQISDAFFDIGATINQGIGYTGSFGGATVGASYSPATNQDIFGVGAKFAWNGLALGIGMQNLDEKTSFAGSVGFSYAGASIALGFDSAENVIPGADDETTIKAKVGYSIAGVSLGLTYEGQTESEDMGVRFDANYDLGGGMNIGTRINAFTDGTDSVAATATTPAVENGDYTNWRIVLGKSF